eukprot:GEMP01063259.1.p1 GENE.GEMP01063259.1~~GEMP01063259.1.p1  ORF type:complete len:209 (+),score=18.61 GEMP01063259.1:68-694(+)
MGNTCCHPVSCDWNKCERIAQHCPTQCPRVDEYIFLHIVPVGVGSIRTPAARSSTVNFVVPKHDETPVCDLEWRELEWTDDEKLIDLRKFIDKGLMGNKIDIFHDGTMHLCSYKLSADIRFVTFKFPAINGQRMTDVIISFQTVTEVLMPEWDPLDFNDVPPEYAREELLMIRDKGQDVIIRFDNDTLRRTFVDCFLLIKHHSVQLSM